MPHDPGLAASPPRPIQWGGERGQLSERVGVAQPRERGEGRLLAAVDRDQPGLPAREIVAVLEQEPGEEVDAGVRPRDVERPAEIVGLLRPGDAEERVRQVRLVAVSVIQSGLRPYRLVTSEIRVSMSPRPIARSPTLRVSGVSDGLP
jgi:hypothetical protein